MKQGEPEQEDEMRAEYDLSRLQGRTRGKYVERYSMTVRDSRNLNVMPEIETERLRLRPFVVADLAAMLRVRGDAAVNRYLTADGAQPSAAQIEADLLGVVARWRENGYDRWAVVLKATGELIGWCGLQPKPTHVDLGYGLARAHWGRDLITEAARASLRHGFEQLRLDAVTAIARAENVGSVRVMQKLGMKFLRRGPYLTHPDVVFYTIARPDFCPDASLYIFRAKPDNTKAVTSDK
ncbi:MAG TPA: GNAT family N-acetyltransferase [Pyrinomonadaceae bacterium]|jgi:ribosomal-protein-alanine N-acetyltransferase